MDALGAEAGEQGSVERLLVDHLEAVARGDPALGEVAQHLGVGIRHPHEGPAHAVGLEVLLPLGLDDDLRGAGGEAGEEGCE